MASSSSPTYYTCSPYSTPELLRTSGEQPVEVIIHYIYELDIPTSSTSTTNNNEVEETATRNLAIEYISSKLLQRMATLGNLIDCNNDNNPFRRQLMRQQRRRQLRFTGRGSTSIIGLSSNPSVDSRIKTDDDDDGSICQFKEGAVGGEMMNEVEKFMEGISPDFSGSVVIMEEERDEDKVNSDNNSGGGGGGEVLAETRVDGVIDPASVVRSALPPQQNHHQQQPAASSSIEEESGSAYNYLSTKSEILEFEPTWTQPDAVVVAPNNRSSSSSSSSVTTFTPPKLRSGGGGAGRRTKCNIIQGQMTLFVSNTADLTYENLDARILNAIRSDLNDELILQQEFLNDENVVGLRLLEPAALTMDDGTLSSSSPVTVAATSSSAPSNTNNNDSGGFTSSYVSIGVISGLGVIFLILIGLFAAAQFRCENLECNPVGFE